MRLQADFVSLQTQACFPQFVPLPFPSTRGKGGGRRQRAAVAQDASLPWLLTGGHAQQTWPQQCLTCPLLARHWLSTPQGARAIKLLLTQPPANYRQFVLASSIVPGLETNTQLTLCVCAVSGLVIQPSEKQDFQFLDSTLSRLTDRLTAKTGVQLQLGHQLYVTLGTAVTLLGPMCPLAHLPISSCANQDSAIYP